MNLENLVRDNIKKLKPYTSARESNLNGILLDANENGLGTTTFKLHENLNRYPDPNQQKMRKIIASYLNIEPEYIVFGVGSDEIIDLTFRIFCNPKIDNVIISEPTYGMYSVCANINDVNIIETTLTHDFQLDVNKILSLVNSNTKIIFICNPNNPTANLIKTEDILSLSKKFNGIIFVDEAYIEFCEENSLIKYIKDYPNLIISRTFSKAWGMAGVRLGYAVANPEIIKYYFKIKAPYNISALTREAFYKALDNIELKNKFVKNIISERERIVKYLSQIKEIEKIYPSDANFILFKVKNALDLYNYLVGKGIIIRYRGNQVNIPDTLRVTVGKKIENNLFLTELFRYFNYENILEDYTSRAAYINRFTNETQIQIEVDLDKNIGDSYIKTGIDFFDHMLYQISRHGNIDLYILCKGDLQVDEHHTVEDVGLALGEAIKKALGDKKGIKRYGYFLPMDESIANCTIDLGGRAYLNFNCDFSREKVGDFPTELTKEFFRALSTTLAANIYIEAKGENDHHKIEAIFKAFAKALNEAARFDERNLNDLPSTKGVL
ncbi:MAG TPA: histidinol-phosphate transaminase [Ignavibacteriales bacterium]|nr:histidinol-phosphate transaminase [Ignavibacteriales bacterium]HOL81162.1 histidinol-phosphate transaminase [Ignavibacteriales bacterium]HOM65265.1 histidinol-phosphate transaminase [Ignavibacteriales bacterium]HPD66557.1 histidinol-phosphate transaminase [Ignavibacteriales bacterium]HPP33482.1 histidinol-phosphate transaminase [Ignavibacteriales bacterium]